MPNKRPQKQNGNKTNCATNNRNNTNRPNNRRRRPRPPQTTNMVNSKATQPSAISQPRTLDTVIRTLSTKMASMNMKSDPYACCRLMGTVPRSPPSIPDGGSGKHACICLYTTDTISATSQFRLQFNPWLPCPGTVTSFDTGMVITSGSGTSITYTNTANSSSSFPQIGRPPQFTTGWGTTSFSRMPGSTIDDPWAASTFRIVSQTHKITYTGPAFSCAGAIQVFENPMSIEQVATTTSNNSVTPPGGTLALSNYGADGALGTGTVTSAPISTMIWGIDGNQAPAPTVTSNIYRPEQGVLVRLKHRGNTFEPQPFFRTLGGLTVNSTSVSNGTTPPGTSANSYWRFEIGGASTASAFYGTGLIGYDNDWVGTHVIGTGLNTDASYLVETCICLEVTPQASSPFAPLARESGPAKPAIIKQVEQQLRAEGTSVPIK